MRDAGLIELRRHHPDIVGQCAGDFLDDLQAGGMDAVVIGAENSHPFKCPFRSIPGWFNAPFYPCRAVEANPAKSSKKAPRRAVAPRRSDRAKSGRRAALRDLNSNPSLQLLVFLYLGLFAQH